MKVSTKKLKDNFVVLDIEVPQETVKKKFDEVYEKINKEAKVPGFRPGKAPRHVLEQHHGKLAHEQAIKSLLSESYQDGIKQENLDVIDVPDIRDVKLDADALIYKAEVEIKPEIKIKHYKGLRLKKKEIALDSTEIEEEIKRLKEGRESDISVERLAKGLGYKTEDEFRDCISKQKYLQRQNEERARLERELIDQLLKMSSFSVPASLVERRTRELEQQARHQMANYGLSEDRIKQRLEEFKTKFKTEAQEQVKVFLILDKIARLENMEIDDSTISHVVEFLFAEAHWE